MSPAIIAASRRSTRASAIVIAPNHLIYDRVYDRELGVSIKQRCPLWVIRGEVAGLISTAPTTPLADSDASPQKSPLFSQKRTFVVQVAMSALGEVDI